jgi:hypothetical protein
MCTFNDKNNWKKETICLYAYFPATIIIVYFPLLVENTPHDGSCTNVRLFMNLAWPWKIIVGRLTGEPCLQNIPCNCLELQLLVMVLNLHSRGLSLAGQVTLHGVSDLLEDSDPLTLVDRHHCTSGYHSILSLSRWHGIIETKKILENCREHHLSLTALYTHTVKKL